MLLEWIERQRLARKGMATDKFRLRREDPERARRLDGHRGLRLVILSLFTILIQVIVAWGQIKIDNEGQMLAFLIFLSGLMLLELECAEVWSSNSKLFLVLSVNTFNVTMIKVLFNVWMSLGHETVVGNFYFLCPCAFAPLLTTLLLGPRSGLYSVVQVSLLSTLVAHHEFNFSFLMFSLLSGFTAVYFSQHVRKRVDLVTAGMALGVTNFLCALVLGMTIGWNLFNVAHQVIFGIGSGMLTALLVSGILPVFETIFRITTPISWIELADLNHPLLQQMTIEAPGSYFHSLVVANLVEAGAKAIGIDPAPCRVIAYFHDIGKMIKPEYFTENIPPGVNPHENLPPNMSALIIISHVKEGVDLALKYQLNVSIIDAIQQHHGDSLVYFFYKKALQQQKDAEEGGKIMNLKDCTIPSVDEGAYHYPGPKPQSKQVGLLCIADSIEAASRCLEKPSAGRIDELVRDIVNSKINDGQLDESHLSLNELRAATEAMANTVKSMLHTRISYAKKGEKVSDSALSQSARRSTIAPPQASEAA